MADRPPAYAETVEQFGAAAGASYGTVTGYGQPNPEGPMAGQAPPGYGPPPPGYKQAPGSYQGGYQSGQMPAGMYQAPAGMYQAPPGYVPAGQHPSYMQPHTINIQPQPSVVIVGGCPACRIGVLEDDFTCLGVCCAIFCFPLGLLCCLATRQRRCPNCGAVFG